MQKIMFNDFFGLTQAVLEGRKTQTRRIVRLKVFSRTSLIEKIINRIFKKDGGDYFFECEGKAIKLPKNKCPRYKVGEIVAIAQRYSDVFNDKERHPLSSIFAQTKAGWSNKMFVKAEYMPRQIRITNVRLERLQDISFEDCLAEGIGTEGEDPKSFGAVFTVPNLGRYTLFARDAYEALIDKIIGKGTWDSNPWVWVYEFELIK